MLHVNDDINDDFFRKAAEDYFLKTENPDWDNLLDKINTADAHPGNEPVIKKKKWYYRFLFFTGSPQKSRYNIFLLLSRKNKSGPELEKNKKKINAGILQLLFILPYDSVFSIT